MVNTGDIHNAEEALKTADSTLSSGDQNLDDVMLAMDVVDTLRHEQNMVEKELAGDERRDALITRLRDIYTAQGIQVPDEVLMDGVLALEEQKFAFEPPKKTLGLKLAKIYINRRRWMPILTLFLFVLGAGWGINHFAFERPAKLEAARVETLFTKTLPGKLLAERDQALAMAKTESIKSQINEIYALGSDAIETRNIGKAEEYTSRLERLGRDISQSYTIRIVSRPGEYSGIFRLSNEDANVKNHYLIVEAIDATGEALSVNIVNEEDQQSERVVIWGVRVSEDVFNRVAADKKDDQIIQNNIIGSKKRGFLEPDYSIETSGGNIVDWSR